MQQVQIFPSYFSYYKIEKGRKEKEIFEFVFVYYMYAGFDLGICVRVCVQQTHNVPKNGILMDEMENLNRNEGSCGFLG